MSDVRTPKRRIDLMETDATGKTVNVALIALFRAGVIAGVSSRSWGGAK